ncbi:hypothetical protein CI610_00375 [invertebrate metagenome]|uniref:Uncharacterized protein n=1 Tax=invertebrate metagenome TaxID=1711999 RepID=A0A2H9TBL1_9ZZZZ
MEDFHTPDISTIQNEVPVSDYDKLPVPASPSIKKTALSDNKEQITQDIQNKRLIPFNHQDFIGQEGVKAKDRKARLSAIIARHRIII